MTDLHAPLPRLSVETALLANGTNLITFLGYIIKKVREARAFRDDCAQLANLCILLSDSFLEHQSLLADIRSGKDFIDCLRKVDQLVTQCTQKWSIRHVYWELTVEGRVEALTKELKACQEAFNSEIAINTHANSKELLTSFTTLKTDLNSVKNTLQRESRDRTTFLAHLEELQAEVKASRQEARSLVPLNSTHLPTVTYPDPRLTVELFNAKPKLGAFCGNPVVFKEIEVPAQATRLIRVYEKIGNIARVQKLYAIAVFQNAHFALMQNMDGNTSIERIIKRRGLDKVSFKERLSFAYELAATVSAFHSADMLVRVISDTTVRVQLTPQNEIFPLLSELDQARGIWEVSARLGAYDVRFQAPEFEKLRVHSKMTDVWRFGNRSDLSCSFPLGLKAADVQSPESKRAVLSKLSNESGVAALITGFEKAMNHTILVLQKCCARDPFIRPSASALAQGLFDIWIAVSSDSTVVDTDLIPDILGNVDSSLSRLSRVIEVAKSSQEQRENKDDTLGSMVSKVDQSVIRQLLHANQDTDPTIFALVGQAYLLDIVEGLVEETTYNYTTKSRDGQCAERALPYLRAAENRDVEGMDRYLYKAYKALYSEHKALALYYAPRK